MVRYENRHWTLEVSSLYTESLKLEDNKIGVHSPNGKKNKKFVKKMTCEGVFSHIHYETTGPQVNAIFHSARPH